MGLLKHAKLHMWLVQVLRSSGQCCLEVFSHIEKHTICKAGFHLSSLSQHSKDEFPFLLQFCFVLLKTKTAREREREKDPPSTVSLPKWLQ